MKLPEAIDISAVFAAIAAPATTQLPSGSGRSEERYDYCVPPAQGSCLLEKQPYSFLMWATVPSTPYWSGPPGLSLQHSHLPQSENLGHKQNCISLGQSSHRYKTGLTFLPAIAPAHNALRSRDSKQLKDYSRSSTQHSCLMEVLSDVFPCLSLLLLLLTGQGLLTWAPAQLLCSHLNTSEWQLCISLG